MKYIYIYAIAVILWVSLPVLIYILSYCKRDQGNDERDDTDTSEKNVSNIVRFEVISCGTIIKTIKQSSRCLSQNHQMTQQNDVESAISEACDGHEMQSMKRTHHAVKHQDSGISIETSDSGNAIQCHICLDDFIVGDEVRTSKNSDCRHLFHNDCIMLWLKSKDHCPVCRQDFLFVCPSKMEDE
jgi:hypothetical protein